MKYKNYTLILIYAVLLTAVLVVFTPSKEEGEGYFFYVRYAIIPLTIGAYFLLRGKFKPTKSCVECDNNDI